MRRVLAALAIVAAGGTGTVQGQTTDVTVAGTWDATWAQAVRTRGSELVEIQRWGEAILTLTTEGDRVRGTWWMEAGGVTWQVAGTIRGGRLTLTASEHDSDDAALAMIESLHFRASVDGSRLEGEMWLEFAGREGGAARRPWRATRRPGGG